MVSSCVGYMASDCAKDENDKLVGSRSGPFQIIIEASWLEVLIKITKHLRHFASSLDGKYLE
jgi:hypothetical protein